VTVLPGGTVAVRLGVSVTVKVRVSVALCVGVELTGGVRVAVGVSDIGLGVIERVAVALTTRVVVTVGLCCGVVVGGTPVRVAVTDVVAVDVAGGLPVGVVVGVGAVSRMRMRATKSAALIRPSWLMSAVAQLLPSNRATVRAPMSAASTSPSQFASPSNVCAGAGQAASSMASATHAAIPPQRWAFAPEQVRPPASWLRMMGFVRAGRPH
jgi:hypothetical protein